MLPVIDLEPQRLAPGSAEAQACVKQLRDACHGPGFCYVEGHGVPEHANQAILDISSEFFALPEAERNALAIANSPHFRGYTVLGDEITRGRSDWREQLDIGPEEPALEVEAGDPPWRRLRGPNQWPPALPGMPATVLGWMAAMDKVGLAVLRALAIGLGQPAYLFDDSVLPRGDPHLKLMRYPAQEREPATRDGLANAAVTNAVFRVSEGAEAEAEMEAGQGVGLHHDSGLVSFVLQDSVGGLQVERNGKLIDVEPRPGSYVMNLGEMMQALTNGYLKATPHRVISPPSGRERISVAYFFHPKLDARFAPIELPPELASQARGGENVDPSDPVFLLFGENYLKIRLRSHPDVARTHYSDLVVR